MNMKKSILLALLPIALVLSSCSSNPKPINQNKMIEDTAAHEEIFGALSHDIIAKPLANKSLPDGVSLYKPAIAFQRKNNNDGTYSVRFVAAMQSATDSAVWTRSVHNTNGQVAQGKGKANVEVTGVYSTINNDGEPSHAVDIEAEDGTKPYDCYAVYCLLNIPSSFSSYYVDAYISVTDGDSTVSSSVGSLNVANADDYMKYELGESSRYVAEVNGVMRESDSLDGNHMTYYSANLKANDKLTALYIDNDNLTYTRYGYSSLVRSNPDFIEGTNNQISVKYDGTYNIFFNSDNQFSFQKKVYFQGPSWWTNKYASGGIEGKHNDEYNSYNMDFIEFSEGVNKYSTFMDISYYPQVQFYRQESGGRYNHTGFVSFPTDGKNCYTRYSNESGGEWTTYGDPVPNPDLSNFTINELTEPVQIHTAAQATYLAYQGDYSTMPSNQYPDGNTHLSDPLPVTVTFNYNVPSGKTVSKYSIVFGQNADLSDGYQVDGDTNKSISFYNAFLGRNYYKLIANFTSGDNEESGIHYFDVDMTSPRNIKIDGMTNCRDMGGRFLEDGGRIKQGLVYRTSGENFLNSKPNDNITSAGKTEMLEHLKVKTEINVSNNDSNVVNLGNGVTLKNLYMDYDSSGTNSSHHLSRNTESLKNFFETLADSNNYPVFFHCRIGTDRTGMCAIFLNGLLGVPLNQIYQDYLFSNFGNIDGKRYIGTQAGQDNIQNYMSEINSLSGTTFKNKIYNFLLSIGLSRTTLDTVIANLTEGTTAQGNNVGQIVAPANQLTASGVTMKTDTSDRNHPDYYFTLNGVNQYVSYTFNAPSAYRGQIVAYLGNSEHSSSKKIADAISVKLDSSNMEVRDITYSNAGMGNCSGRMNYYPVILGIANIGEGSHTITIYGTSNQMNVAGISIFDATTAVDVGGGALTDPEHEHSYDNGTIIQAATHSAAGIKRYACSCGSYYDEAIPTIPYSWVSAGTSTSGTGTSYETFNCSHCTAKKIEVVATSGTFASGSTNKTGTPSGFIKLNSNGNSISYTFNYSGTGTARLYQRGIMDVWSSNSGKMYSSNGTGSNGCNFLVTFNNTAVDMTEMKNVTYQTMLSNGVDAGVSGDYSPMDDCLLGTVQLVNGTNSFTYTRQASYNLLVHDFVIIID